MANELEMPTGFTINLFYERLIELRRTNAKAFESISPPSKLALAQYERLKREHQQQQAMRRESNLPPAV
jgi:hypothetical protein